VLSRYLLTGEDRYLEPYNRGVSNLQTRLDGLQKLAEAGELPKAKVDQVVQLSRQKEDEPAEFQF
jgi:CHASE3 domain sensor protein